MDILLLEDLATDARQWLAARHQVDYRPELLDDEGLLHQRLQRVNALVVPPRLKINTQLLDAAPHLAAVGRIHDGTENIDFEACQKRRVRVIQASSATVRASAEYLLLSLLSLFRQGVRRRGDGDDERLTAPDSPLHGLTNLRITPRLAPFTQESQLRGSWYLADRIHETLLLSELHSQLGPTDSEPMPLA